MECYTIKVWFVDDMGDDHFVMESPVFYSKSELMMWYEEAGFAISTRIEVYKSNEDEWEFIEELK